MERLRRQEADPGKICVTGIQDVIRLSCDDCGGNYENYSFEPLCPSDWSVEFVGEFRFGELSKRVIQGQFSDSEGAEPVGFSHRNFCFVV